MNSLWHGPVTSAEQLMTTPVPITGVAGTASVGTATVAAKANITISGVIANGSVGTLTNTGALAINITGVAASGLVGNVIASNVIDYIIGNTLTGSVGDLTISITRSVNITGVTATGAIGTNFGIVGVAEVSLVGVVTTATAGGVMVWGDIFNDPGNTWTEIF